MVVSEIYLFCINNNFKFLLAAYILGTDIELVLVLLICHAATEKPRKFFKVYPLPINIPIEIKF